jgi:hypothetical protein
MSRLAVATPLPPRISEPPGAWGPKAWEGLLVALSHVDSLPADACGALVVGGGERPSAGLILVERGRVCWAAASGMRDRLRDILRRHCLAKLDDGELEAFFQRTRDEGKPLGEALERSGLVSAAALRAALVEQTVESLLAIGASLGDCDGSWQLRWVEGPARGYSPRFTFATAEIAASIGARVADETAAALASDHLERIAGTGSAAVAFTAGPLGAPHFFGLRSMLALEVRDLLELADWATAALEASAGFSAINTHALAQSMPAGAVAWQYERQLYAAACPSRESLHRLVVALGNQDLPLVLATRLSVLERIRERTAIPLE